MARFIVSRLIMAVPLLLAITVVSFAFINLAPGDPVTAMISPEDQLREEDLQRMRENLGLNDPLPIRYALWLQQAIQGNLGYSYTTGESVVDRISVRLWPTLELMGAALLISTAMGVILGVISALKVYSRWDYAISIFTLLGLSIPGFFFALVVLYLFSARWEIMPAFGMSDRDGGSPIIDNLHHLILPAAVLSLELTASLTRYARSSMLDVLNADYVVTARAKGLSEYATIVGHAFRNALLPMITVVSLRLPLLLGGAIVIESMFQWPGMGLLSLQAIQQRDYPVLMGLTFVTATLVLTANLIADVLYAFADPRIRQ